MLDSAAWQWAGPRSSLCGFKSSRRTQEWQNGPHTFSWRSRRSIAAMFSSMPLGRSGRSSAVEYPFGRPILPCDVGYLQAS
jgi:hypothetical protein